MRLRGSWVPVDPREWRNRDDLEISVGLGAGDRAQQLATLTQMLNMQVGASKAGLANPQNVFNALKRWTNAAGFRDASEFWADPAQQPPKQNGPPPEVQIEQMRGQVTMQVEQMRSQMRLQEQQAQLQLQASNDQRDSAREAAKAQADAQLQMQAQQMELQIAQMQAAMDKYKADLDAQTKLMIAGQQAVQPAPGELESDALEVDAASRGGYQDMQQQEQPDKTEMLIGALSGLMQQMQALQEQGQALHAAHRQAMQGQAHLAQLIAAPKELVRGPDGKVVGSRIAPGKQG